MLDRMKLILWFNFINKVKAGFYGLIYRLFWDILMELSFVTLVSSIQR